MKIKYTYIERIEITGPARGSDAAFAYCERYGYHIVRSGPKRINAMNVDSTKFVIIAERETPPNVAANVARPERGDMPPHQDAE